MPQYRRLYVPGGTYFFTVVSYKRRPILTHPTLRRALRKSILDVKARNPFEIVAWVLLPDHMHCVWRMPEGDADFSSRWSQIKRITSQQVVEKFHDVRLGTTTMYRRRELTVWQRRFWERWIRHENELKHTIRYIHWNPIKHGLVNRVEDWPFSTYHRFRTDGPCPPAVVSA
jgi:putative transposase